MSYVTYSSDKVKTKIRRIIWIFHFEIWIRWIKYKQHNQTNIINIGKLESLHNGFRGAYSDAWLPIFMMLVWLCFLYLIHLIHISKWNIHIILFIFALTLSDEYVTYDIKLVFTVALTFFLWLIMTVASSVCYVLPHVESPSLYGYDMKLYKRYRSAPLIQ